MPGGGGAQPGGVPAAWTRRAGLGSGRGSQQGPPAPRKPAPRKTKLKKHRIPSRGREGRKPTNLGEKKEKWFQQRNVRFQSDRWRAWSPRDRESLQGSEDRRPSQSRSREIRTEQAKEKTQHNPGRHMSLDQTGSPSARRGASQRHTEALRTVLAQGEKPRGRQSARQVGPRPLIGRVGATHGGGSGRPPRKDGRGVHDGMGVPLTT